VLPSIAIPATVSPARQIVICFFRPTLRNRLAHAAYQYWGPIATDLSRDSPDEPRTDVNGSPILNWLKAQIRRTAFQAAQAVFEGLIWPFPWHLDALLPSVALERMTIERLTLALVVAAAAVLR
jgi:hypothetical protein